MNVVFRNVRWKNFLSTGNIFTEMQLAEESATLVVGSNGSGKSTMLDAICFGLFGKPFRNVNKPQLLNSINQKDCVVEVEFDTGNKSYRVVRGMKPNIFEIYCNGTLISQSAANRDYQEHLEKFILKLNFKSFTQIVILGSASFTPFMQLTANDRRMIIEDLLDIQIFSRMNGVLKEKYAKLKDDIADVKRKHESAKDKHDILVEHAATLVKGNKDRIQQKRDVLDKESTTIAAYEKQIETLSAEIDDLRDKTKDQSSIQSKLQRYDNIESNLNKTLKKVAADISLYTETEECPVCKQGIPHEHKKVLIDEREGKLKDVESAIQDLNRKYNQEVDRLEKINKLLTQMDEKSKECATLSRNLTASYKYIGSLKEELDEMEKPQEDIKEIKTRIGDLQHEMTSAAMSEQTLTSEKHYLDVATNLLKDTGIKTKIIRQYIPVINKFVNKYLSAMDFFVNFTLDESFKETIKSRHRDDFCYASFSEGEKQRIDMALMLTWRAVAKLKNSSNTNLLILDEVFDSSLDTNGTEDLMKILNMLESTNLFVISHRGDILQDKFRNVIRFEKMNNFSRMIK
jgi:DNA repair exonuclease SbcCD ATPase subunit